MQPFYFLPSFQILKKTFSLSSDLESVLNTENLVNPIAYADLTEDIVIGWLSGIKSTVENKVEGNINGNDETIIKTMPWH